MGNGLRFINMEYGVRFMVHGFQLMGLDSWFLFFGSWFMVYGICFKIYDLGLVVYGFGLLFMA